ncbi:MAG TPA: hypothetical protein VK826_18800 [Bacteroidia bacterium]|nr:hypothetical protein [Bacteroidia bacterium]
MKKVLFFAFVLIVAYSCKHESQPEDTPPPVSTPDINNTYGYGVLDQVKGIWNGPVTSTTALGGYPEWIVDFRPISASQVSAKNELDSVNSIHMSFFIALHNNAYKIAFRNGGGFGGQQRISYFLADSVSELANESFYRFSEVIQGTDRAYTELIFRADSLYMKSYTNVYNTLVAPTLHMTWAAKLQDTTSCQDAVTQFGFPQKTNARDFTHTFDSMLESIFYNVTSDPYPESAQPYLGQSAISYTYAGSYSPVATNRVILIIATQPLFSGFTFLSANMKFRSRYVILPADDLDFTFNYMHPGTYYLYAFYDSDGNMAPNSGDWISTANATFTLGTASTTAGSALINFTIP